MEEIKVEKKYVEFIDNLTLQISALLPDDINKLQYDYLVNNIRHSTLLLASSMQTEEVFKRLSFEQQQGLIQIMAEWSFHKEIDLFRSGISPKYWKVVMQKIWYTMWEVMYACVQNGASENVTLNLIERYVGRTYKDAITDLKENNIIDAETEQQAREQSNIDIMALEYRKKLRIRKFLKIIYYIFMFFVISAIVSYVVLKFKTLGIIACIVFLVIYNVMPKGK